jgi:uncharacterized protein (TIRG00374 family)
MKPSSKKLPGWLPGAIVSLAFIAAILYFVDLKKVGAALAAADFRLLLGALAISLAWLAVRAIVWRSLLQNRASYKDVFLSLSEGYLMNNLLPFRLGELGKAFLLSRKSKLTFMEILPTVVIERVIDIAFSAAMLAGAVPFVVGAAGAERIAMVVGAVVVAGLVVLYLLARNREWALGVFHKLSARWPSLQRLGGGFLESFFAGLAVLTDARWFLRFLFWMTVNWGMAIAQYTLIVRAFYPQATVAWGMFSLGAAAFGGAIPSLPGAVGTYEGALAGAMTLLSGDQSTALAVALTMHLYNYLTSGPIGMYALSLEGETLAGIYRQLMNLRAKEGSSTEPKTEE